MGKNANKSRSGAERGCVHSTLKRRSGFEIVMECSRCPAEPTLDSQKCFGNVLIAIQREGVPVAVTLRSHVERRYALEASACMGRMAGVLNKLDSLQAQLERDSKRSEACVACVRPLSGKLAIAASRLRGMDLNSAVSSAWDLESEVFGSGRPACADCAGMTRVQLSEIARSLRELEKSLSKGDIVITEAES
jgi:hypothetical protein